MPFSIEGEQKVMEGVFRPEAPNPAGARLAWVLLGISAFVGFFMNFFGLGPPLLFWLAVGILFVVALAVTFSNWLERRSVIILSETKIHFQSPFRNIEMLGADIQELWCAKIQGGWRYLVSGSEGAFRFQSLTVVRTSKDREVKSGFAQGREIARWVYSLGELLQLDRSEDIWIYRKSS